VQAGRKEKFGFTGTKAGSGSESHTSERAASRPSQTGRDESRSWEGENSMQGQLRVTSTGTSRKRTALYAAVLVLTVVLSSGATMIGFKLLTEPRPPAKTLDTVKLASGAGRSAAGTAAPAKQAVASTRLVVAGPQRLLDTRRTGALPPGGEANIPLPSSISPDSTAVLLGVSLLNAAGPGQVSIKSDADDVPALRLAAKKYATSATVVVLLGSDHKLRLKTVGGGQVLVDLLGDFEPTDSAAAGRVVPVDPERVLRLRPGVDGNDVDLKIADMAALRKVGSVSAVLLHLSGDVGVHGGHVYFGPSKARLNQQVLWGPTSGADRTRHGFVLVPVPKGKFHLQYHAGTELRVELVGYVTGAKAANSAAGLIVPLPYQAASAVRVATAGRTNVTVVPAAGLSGVSPDRVTAAIFSLATESNRRGDIALTTPGRKAGYPILSVAPAKQRVAATLTRVAKGQVTVAGVVGAQVILTPRALIIGR
jgi:hypothetical protein